MICRMWRGLIPTDRASEYAEIVERTGMAGYRATPGNVDAQILLRDLGDGTTEIRTLSWWRDLADIEAFTGPDIETARYYPDDDGYLLDPRDTSVRHWQVWTPGATAGRPTSS